MNKFKLQLPLIFLFNKCPKYDTKNVFLFIENKYKLNFVKMSKMKNIRTDVDGQAQDSMQRLNQEKYKKCFSFNIECVGIVLLSKHA